MNYYIALVTLSLTAFMSYAQDNDSITESGISYSESYVPAACLDSTLYIEKKEEVPYHELLSIIQKEKTNYDKDRVIKGVEFYNTVSVVRLNQQFEEICADEKNLNISTIYAFDCEKKPRYTIVSEYDYGYYDHRDDVASYALFDNKEGIRYKDFASVELLLASIKASETYLANGVNRDQDDLDAYLEKKVRKLYRQSGPNAGGNGRVGYVLLGILNLTLLIAIFATL